MRERQNLPTTVSVSWPRANPEFIFEIARFSPDEADKARFDADGIRKKRGLETPKDGDPEALKNWFVDAKSTSYYTLAPIVWRHLKGWKHTPPEGHQPVEYSAAEAKKMFDVLEYWEKVEIGMGYSEALEALTKKKENAPPMEPDSSKHSGRGSEPS